MAYGYLTTKRENVVHDQSNLEELFTAMEVLKKQQELKNILSTINAQSNGPFLSTDLVERIANYQSKTLVPHQRLRQFENSALTDNYQGIAYELILKQLESDHNVRSVANIGCGFAYYDGLLAETYNQVDFFCYDFNDDLLDKNHSNASKGVTFIEGYPLATFSATGNQCDLVYFTSTATTIRNIELHKYVELIAQKSKIIIFSEPVYPDPLGNVIDPNTIQFDQSEVVFCQRDPYDNTFGYLCFVHNYRLIAEYHGFKTITYEVKKYERGPYWWVTYVGLQNN